MIVNLKDLSITCTAAEIDPEIKPLDEASIRSRRRFDDTQLQVPKGTDSRSMGGKNLPGYGNILFFGAEVDPGLIVAEFNTAEFSFDGAVYSNLVVVP